MNITRRNVSKPQFGDHMKPSRTVYNLRFLILLFLASSPSIELAEGTSSASGSKVLVAEAKQQHLNLLLPLSGGSTTTNESNNNISKKKRGKAPATKSGSASTTSAATFLSSRTVPDATNGVSRRPFRVAYQGEPGAYSEKSTRELLGDNVIAIGRSNFEECFRAVTSMECEYACLPVENSLGGSIHENYDLMLRYNLHIVAEHEFRVSHCLLVKPGVSKEQIKYAISHPQALAQCDNYLRALNITPVPSYDTAGSAKMIADAIRRVEEGEESDSSGTTLSKEGGSSSSKGSRKLPRDCTPDNTCAIASDLAGQIYGLECLAEGIEDDDSNFTRFLLLGRNAITQHMSSNIPAKTSIVFTLPNQSGALYKALACFSLRDIDFSKIESRPTSASLLSFLKFRSQLEGSNRGLKDKGMKLPRFRYCFYLDFLANELDEDAMNAMHHLQEQADFCRVLGSYPQKSRLVGPVHEAAEQLKKQQDLSIEEVSLTHLESDFEDSVKRLNVGIIGFGPYGQFLARKIRKYHSVSCTDLDNDKAASRDVDEMMGGGTGSTSITYYPKSELETLVRNSDIILLAVPLIKLEQTVSTQLPLELLRGKLVVETCQLSSKPVSLLLENLPSDVDVLSITPLFGPMGGGGAAAAASSSSSWDGLPLLYENVRISSSNKHNLNRLKAFLAVFEHEYCKMVEMSIDQMDACVADATFLTQLIGRVLSTNNLLKPSFVASQDYEALLKIVDKIDDEGSGAAGAASKTSEDDKNDFYGIYRYNHASASKLLRDMRENLVQIERDLASKEAYLQAKQEMQEDSRSELLSEAKALLRETAAAAAASAAATATT